MKVDTYQSHTRPAKYLTVRAGTRLSELPAILTSDPEMGRLTPLLLGYDLLSSAYLEGFDAVRLTSRIQMTGFAVHHANACDRAAAGQDAAASCRDPLRYHGASECRIGT